MNTSVLVTGGVDKYICFPVGARLGARLASDESSMALTCAMWVFGRVHYRLDEQVSRF